MQVWKEVDGILPPTSPKVKSARVLARSPRQRPAELTYFGSEVLHPFTMERVVSAQVPIRIKNTFRPGETGTVITNEPQPPRAASLRSRSSAASASVITSTGCSTPTASWPACSAHWIVTGSSWTWCPQQKSASRVPSTSYPMQSAPVPIWNSGQVMLSPDRAILAVVGAGIKGTTGTGPPVFHAGSGRHRRVEMIGPQVPRINISCIVKEGDAQRGLEAIHSAFFD